MSENKYRALVSKQAEEFYAFPMAYGFGEEGIARGMRSLGLDPSERDRVVAFGDSGGFYRKEDQPKLREMFERHAKERQDAIERDKTGLGFVQDMFVAVLSDTEYPYTGDVSDALDRLGYTLQDVMSDKRLLNGLKAAKKKLRCNMD